MLVCTPSPFGQSTATQSARKILGGKCGQEIPEFMLRSVPVSQHNMQHITDTQILAGISCISLSEHKLFNYTQETHNTSSLTDHNDCSYRENSPHIRRISWRSDVTFNDKQVNFETMSPTEIKEIQRRMRVKHTRKWVNRDCVAANRRFLKVYASPTCSRTNIQRTSITDEGIQYTSQ